MILPDFRLVILTPDQLKNTTNKYCINKLKIYIEVFYNGGYSNGQCYLWH